MAKFVLTGSSCCLKSSVGQSLNGHGLQFIKSDSDLLREMRSYNLIDYNFLPRILFKGYTMRMQSDEHANLLFERSMIDQLVFASIMSTGWFDLDEELDYRKVLEKTNDILTFEKSIGIKRYILLENHNEDFLHKIIDDPEFENSPRWDSYYTVDDYIKFREMFTELYSKYVSSIGGDLEIIKVEGNATTSPEEMISNVKSVMAKALWKE